MPRKRLLESTHLPRPAGRPSAWAPPTAFASILLPSMIFAFSACAAAGADNGTTYTGIARFPERMSARLLHREDRAEDNRGDHHPIRELHRYGSRLTASRTLRAT